MSLFQCDGCGCLENTSCSGGGYHLATNMEPREYRPAGHEALARAAASYKEILGLAPDQPFGSYCSVCDPAWWADDNTYGVGPRPEGYADKHADYHTGKWHDTFERIFLPKGLWHMNEDGNLASILTLSTDTETAALPAEEDLVLPPQFRRMPDHGLPRPRNREECRRYLDGMSKWIEAVDHGPEHLRPPTEAHRRMLLMHFATQERRAEYEWQERAEKRQMRTAARDVGPITHGARKLPVHSRAGAMAIAAMAVAAGHMPSVGFAAPREEPEPLTPEELEAARARSTAKLCKADKKREMKAAKRAKVTARAN